MTMATIKTIPPPEETRDKLMIAAGEVFAEVGYQAATTREICARAGANIAAVNYHFGDKLGLYTEMLKDAVLQGENRMVDSTSTAKTPEEALRQFISRDVSEDERRGSSSLVRKGHDSRVSPANPRLGSRSGESDTSKCADPLRNRRQNH